MLYSIQKNLMLDVRSINVHQWSVKGPRLHFKMLLLYWK